ncbi:PorP/SprF family type IX secretion system membrane protein [Lewinella sp. 4G2]|uniref:PorP/SprF family type IX secretion system membrane protein n=1 Tax=Lewinella sp. 4G2 TaxID=1803372 RepID=UPI0007B4D173|nr:PorP/SprF family type IX secretion system membrane protein [Lewinella sp. 4G2]OAV44161.1 hypothetical protein A3850_006470 [Lewinella sp. 4G2]
MRLLATFLLILSFAVGDLSAQDPVFSQFYASPVRLNPALAGVSTAPRITLNYRAQHAAFPSAFTTMAMSYEQPVHKTPSNFAFRVMSDRQLEGAYRNTEAALVYSYNVKFSNNFQARLGLSAGILNTSLDFNRLVFGDVIDPLTGAGNEVSRERLEAVSRIAADFGAGVILYGGPFYGGFSFDHLNRPDENLLQLNEQLYAGRPMRLTLTGGAQIDLIKGRNVKRPAYITPNFLYSSQARFQQLNIGSYFGYGPVAIGGWYRHAFENADALILSISARKDVLRVGFSYDAVVSDLRNVTGGLGPTFELSLAVDFGDSKKLQRERFKRRYSECFRMFQ